MPKQALLFRLAVDYPSGGLNDSLSGQCSELAWEHLISSSRWRSRLASLSWLTDNRSRQSGRARPNVFDSPCSTLHGHPLRDVDPLEGVVLPCGGTESAARSRLSAQLGHAVIAPVAAVGRRQLARQVMFAGYWRKQCRAPERATDCQPAVVRISRCHCSTRRDGAEARARSENRLAWGSFTGKAGRT